MDLARQAGGKVDYKSEQAGFIRLVRKKRVGVTKHKANTINKKENRKVHHTLQHAGIKIGSKHTNMYHLTITQIVIIINQNQFICSLLFLLVQPSYPAFSYDIIS